MTTRIPEGHGGVETKPRLKLVYSAPQEQSTADALCEELKKCVDDTIEQQLTAFDRLVESNSDVAAYVRRFDSLDIDTTAIHNMFVKNCSAHDVFKQFQLMTRAILYFYKRFASRENGVHLGLFQGHEQEYVPFRREAERIADVIEKNPNLYVEVKALEKELDDSVNISREVPKHVIFRKKD